MPGEHRTGPDAPTPPPARAGRVGRGPGRRRQALGGGGARRGLGRPRSGEGHAGGAPARGAPLLPRANRDGDRALRRFCCCCSWPRCCCWPGCGAEGRLSPHAGGRRPRTRRQCSGRSGAAIRARRSPWTRPAVRADASTLVTTSSIRAPSCTRSAGGLEARGGVHVALALGQERHERAVQRVHADAHLGHVGAGLGRGAWVEGQRGGGDVRRRAQIAGSVVHGGELRLVRLRLREPSRRRRRARGRAGPSPWGGPGSRRSPPRW